VHGDAEAQERAHVQQRRQGAVLLGQERDGVVENLFFVFILDGGVFVCVCFAHCRREWGAVCVPS